MRAYVVEETDGFLRLGLKDPSTTIIEPIIQELNADGNVVFARYIEEHPYLDDPFFEVRVSKGSPRDAIKKASKSVSKYFSAVTE